MSVQRSRKTARARCRTELYYEVLAGILIMRKVSGVTCYFARCPACGWSGEVPKSKFRKTKTCTVIKEK